LTGSRDVALHTADRRLAAAVASFSGEAGRACIEVPLAPVPVPPPALAVLDLRGAAPSAVAPWVESGAVVVAVVADATAAREVMAQGAHDWAFPERAEAEVPLRAAAALAPTPDRPRTAALRRLVRHDIRSPLAVILGQCEILVLGLGGPLSDKQRKSVDAIERKAQELRAMVERLATDLGQVLGWDAGTRADGPSPR
jgi:signal transduction histidine kinase